MRAKNLYARETDEQSEARLEDLRMRAQNRYATETDEQHQARLDDLRPELRSDMLASLMNNTKFV